jgi:hypothetical protein
LHKNLTPIVEAFVLIHGDHQSPNPHSAAAGRLLLAHFTNILHNGVKALKDQADYARAKSVSDPVRQVEKYPGRNLRGTSARRLFVASTVARAVQMDKVSETKSVTEDFLANKGHQAEKRWMSVRPFEEVSLRRLETYITTKLGPEIARKMQGKDDAQACLPSDNAAFSATGRPHQKFTRKTGGGAAALSQMAWDRWCELQDIDMFDAEARKRELLQQQQSVGVLSEYRKTHRVSPDEDELQVEGRLVKGPYLVVEAYNIIWNKEQSSDRTVDRWYRACMEMMSAKAWRRGMALDGLTRAGIMGLMVQRRCYQKLVELLGHDLEEVIAWERTRSGIAKGPPIPRLPTSSDMSLWSTCVTNYLQNTLPTPLSNPGYNLQLEDGASYPAIETTILPELGGKVRVASCHPADEVHVSRGLTQRWLKRLRRQPQMSDVLRGQRIKLTRRQPNDPDAPISGDAVGLNLEDWADALILESADLSAATDYIGHEVAQRVWLALNRAAGEDQSVLCEAGLRILGPKTIVDGETTVGGIHMGLGLSWIILCVVNSWAAEEAGIPRSAVAICGDDLASLCLPAEAEAYQRNLTSLGMVVNRSKSYRAKAGVFCEQFVAIDGTDESPHELGEVVTARSYPLIGLSEATGAKSDLGISEDKYTVMQSLIKESMQCTSVRQLPKPERDRPWSLQQPAAATCLRTAKRLGKGLKNLPEWAGGNGLSAKAPLKMVWHLSQSGKCSLLRKKYSKSTPAVWVKAQIQAIQDSVTNVPQKGSITLEAARTAAKTRAEWKRRLVVSRRTPHCKDALPPTVIQSNCSLKQISSASAKYKVLAETRATTRSDAQMWSDILASDSLTSRSRKLLHRISRQRGCGSKPTPVMISRAAKLLLKGKCEFADISDQNWLVADHPLAFRGRGINHPTA